MIWEWKVGQIGFFTIYTRLECVGALSTMIFCSPAGNGLSSLKKHIPRLLLLGVNALYFIEALFLNQVLMDTDTVDYYYVDRRLGNNNDLKTLVHKFHDNGISVILDAVFNHTGRDFFAFKDTKEKKNNSQYCSIIDWYLNIDFFAD